MRIPDDDASAPDWILFEQSGVLTWAQAVGALSPAKVRHLVYSGRWRRVCRGVLSTWTGPATRDQQWWVAVLAAGRDAVLGGLAAARAGGLRGHWRYEAVPGTCRTSTFSGAGRTAPRWPDRWWTRRSGCVVTARRNNS